MFDVGNKVELELFPLMEQKQWAQTEIQKNPIQMKSFFTVMVFKYWNRFPRKIVESVSLDIIKI